MMAVSTAEDVEFLEEEFDEFDIPAHIREVLLSDKWALHWPT